MITRGAGPKIEPRAFWEDFMFNDPVSEINAMYCIRF